MKAIVNGEERDLGDGMTIGGLLELLGAPRNGIAVARNDSVVARAEHDRAQICEGDRIEIIRAVAGG